jgi:DNA-binding NtrC family response regulator
MQREPGLLRELTYQIVSSTLASNKGDKTLTARQLGIGRATLYRMLKRMAEGTRRQHG